MRILAVEDDEITASVIRMLLEDDLDASVDTALDCSSAREFLSSNNYDLITLDYQLPDGDGLSLLQEIVETGGPPPIIMVTGHGDEQTAVSAFKLGASGYVVKDARVSTMLIEEARSALARAGQARAEAELKASDERYRSVVANTRNGIAVYAAVRGGEDFVFTDFNRAAQAIDGVSREDVVGRSVLEVFPGVREFGLLKVFQRVWRTGVPERYPVRQYTDERITGWRDNYVYRLSSGEVVSVYEDVTERKEAEAALRIQYNLAVTLGAATDLGGAYEKVLDTVLMLESIDSGGIYVIDPESGVIDLAAHRGLSGEFIEAVSHYDADSRRSLASVLRAGECVYGKYEEAISDVDETRRREGLRALALAPITHEGRLVAALSLASHTKDEISERDKRLIEAFAAQLGNLLMEKAAEEALGKSEERYQSVVQSIHDALIVTDADFNISGWNDAATEIYGYTAEEAAGRNPGHLLATQYEGTSREKLVAELAEKGRLRCEVLQRRKDGTPVYIESVMTPFENAEGGIDGYVAVSRDITGRRLAEKALRQSEARYRTLFESSLDGIVSVDMEGWITGANQAYLDMLGYGLEEVRQLTYQQLTPERWHELEQSLVETQIIVRGYSDEYEKEYMRKDGSVFPISIRTWVIRGEDGNPTGMWAIVRDVTDRKAAEEALRESEERLVSAQEVSRLGSWEYDVDSHEIEWSLETYRLYERDPALGPPTEDEEAGYYSEEQARILRQYAARAIAEGTGFEYDFEVRLPGGRRAFYSATLQPAKDDSGRVTRLYGTAQDITERIEAEAERRAAEELYRKLLYTSPDAITVSDIEGKIIEASMHTVELLGFDSVEELMGTDAFELIAPADRARAAEALAVTLEEGFVRNVEYTLLRKDGSSFAGELSASVLRDSEGDVIGFLAAVRDITRRKAVEEALQRANEELEGYARTVSHDLRSPLSAVVLGADILARALEKEGTVLIGGRVEDALRLIRNGARRAMTLIEDLLALANAGQSTAICEPVDISEVLRSILLEKEALLEERGVRVSVDDDLGVAAMEPTHAYQVFSNLVGNAIKHNDGPKPQVEVRLLPAEAPGTLRYLVRDNGPGVPEGAEEEIFLPFHRGPDATDTGIGLSVVDKIVRLYGGQVRARNDGGACFEFTLPLYRKDEP